MQRDALDLGWRSHLVASAFGACIDERDDCIVLRTPDNPAYYWGNCLIVPQPPRDADVAHWLWRFDAEIASRQPQSRHVAIGISAPRLDAPLPAWRDAGFDCEETMALSLQRAGLRSAPGAKVDDVTIRALQLPAEAKLAIDLQCEGNDGGYPAAGYRRFRERLMARASAMHAAGVGLWFAAFVGARPVADCGLVHDGRLGRFQQVGTHRAFRRLGLCRTLVHEVCRFAFDELRLQTLVMCADPHDVAIGIYRSLGFEPVSGHWQLQRRAPEDRA